jgi:hypothetical protein
MDTDAFPGGRPLFIGSLPFGDHRRALEEVLARTPETPHWVQLPCRPEEGFLVQFCEGAPGLRVEPHPRFETLSAGFEAELLSFYEEFLAVSEERRPLAESRFAVSRRAAPGLFLLTESLGGRTPLVVKGQLSGPLTVLLGIKDASERCAYYDERLREAVVKLLSLKARFQTQLLGAGGSRAMVFVDEPALGSVGSSVFIGVSPGEALSDLSEILRGIASAGGWPGVHVCANADWGALLLEELRVLSFDAFSYFDRVALFRRGIEGFLQRGGMLAWGIVPTSAQILPSVDPPGLAALWWEQAEALGGGRPAAEKILERTFITPSCGLGTLSPDQALRAMDLTVAVSDLVRQGR